MAANSNIAVYQSCIAAAQDLKDFFASTGFDFNASQWNDAPLTDIPRVELPAPVSIDATLLKAGCPSEIIDRVSRIYSTSAHDLRLAYEKQIYQTCQESSRCLPSIPHSHSYQDIATAFTSHYQTALAELKDATLRLVQKDVASVSEDWSDEEEDDEMCQTENSVRDFFRAPQHLLIPLSQNAYFLLESIFQRGIHLPRRHEKAMLSKKTGLSYRQIGVWVRRQCPFVHQLPR